MDTFDLEEKRNITLYILGLTFYSIGLEIFNGSIITLALDRFRSQTFEKLGILVAVNQLSQFAGAIVIVGLLSAHELIIQGPLVKWRPPKALLSFSAFALAAIPLSLLIIDRITGGKIQDSGPRYGEYDPNFLYPIFILTGTSIALIN